MLFHVVRKELLDQLLSLRFAIASVLCLVVLVLSSIVLTRDYREAMSTYNMNTVLHRNEILQKDQVWALWEGMSVDRPLNPMNVLVRGLRSELTESVKVQGQNRLDFTEVYEQNPMVPLFPAVDFIFIVGIIMSLLALAFSYDAVSGERESGVLKLLMSYSIPRDTVLLGKWIGGYLALIAPFLLAFLVAMTIPLLYQEVQIGLETTLALIGLLAVALLYLGTIYSLGLFISSRTALTSTSITVLLLIWVVFILALPNMAPYIAGQFAPIPSRESVDRDKQEIQQQRMDKLRKIIEDERAKASDEELQTNQDLRNRIEEYQKETEAEMQKVEDSYQAKVRVQTRMSGIVARLSPLTSFNLAALDLSAAGIEQETRFVDALKNHSETWENYAEEKRKPFQNESGGFSFNSSTDPTVNFDDYPVFKFTYMEFGERLNQVYLDGLFLVLWNLLFFGLAYLSFSRYPIH